MCRELTVKKIPGNNRNGFTLTEVIVASALLVAAIVPILKGLANAHVVSMRIERKTKSLSLAQGKLDELKARSIYNYAASFNASSAQLETNYLCNVTDTAMGSDLRKVKVDVGFDADSDNILDTDEINITLVTQFAKRW